MDCCKVNGEYMRRGRVVTLEEGDTFSENGETYQIQRGKAVKVVRKRYDQCIVSPQSAFPACIHR